MIQEHSERIGRHSEQKAGSASLRARRAADAIRPSDDGREGRHPVAPPDLSNGDPPSLMLWGEDEAALTGKAR